MSNDYARSQNVRFNQPTEFSPSHTRSGRVYSAEQKPVLPAADIPYIGGADGAAGLVAAAVGAAYTYGMVQWAKWIAPPISNPKANGVAGDVYHDSYLSFKYPYSPPKRRMEVFAAHPPPG